MTFLAPLFLLGFAALAIPVFIHLTHRERRDPIVFPSLMFLRKMPFKTQRRQRIRHWLLFALRAAAFVLFAAAFARPLLEGSVLGGGLSGTARDVIVLLDQSYSMGYGERWSRATGAARDAIAGLGPEDRLTLVTFAEQAAALNQPTGDQPRLLVLLDRVRPGAGATRFEPALQLARDLLDQSNRPRREAVLITDFQQSGWTGTADVRLPSGGTVTHVDVSGGAGPNRSVAGVLLDRSPEQGGRVTVSARITNAGDEPADGLAVELEVAGQLMQTQTVDVPPHGSALVRFTSLALPPAAAPGRVRTAGDALPADDTFHFLLRPIPRIPVLLVENPNANPDEMLFLRRALEIGRDPVFDVTVRRTSRLEAGELADAAVVVLNDAPFPGGEPGRQLARFVANGGGLLVVLGRRTGGLPAFLRDSVGGPTGEAIDRLDDRGGTLSITEYSHPVFAPFATPRSGDFSAARFFRYRRLAVPAGVSTLARLDDGGPALTAARYGEGRVLLWASGLGNAWNDLPLQPVFLPFVHQVVRYLAAFAEPPAAYVAGSVLDIASFDLPIDEELVVEAPSGERSARQPGDDLHVELVEAGLYAIHPLGRRAGDGMLAAVNADRREADLAAMDPEELLAAMRATDADGSPDAVARAELTPIERERRQGVWWVLLLAALVALTAESFLASRLSVARR